MHCYASNHNTLLLWQQLATRLHRPSASELGGEPHGSVLGSLIKRRLSSSLSNDKLLGTLVLNCAISELACFAWLQSVSNPSPGPSLKLSCSRSICQTCSSEPPLPLGSLSTLTSLKCQPEYLLSHRWVNSGDPLSVAPDLLRFLSITFLSFSCVQMHNV